MNEGAEGKKHSPGRLSREEPVRRYEVMTKAHARVTEPQRRHEQAQGTWKLIQPERSSRGLVQRIPREERGGGLMFKA